MAKKSKNAKRLDRQIKGAGRLLKRMSNSKRGSRSSKGGGGGRSDG